MRRYTIFFFTGIAAFSIGVATTIVRFIPNNRVNQPQDIVSRFSPIPDTDPLLSQAISKEFLAGSHIDRAKLLIAFQKLVDEDAKVDKSTLFMNTVTPDSTMNIVYWVENRELILVEDSYTENWENVLLWSRRRWNLDKDVVPTVNEVAGSNYILTRAEARKMVADCKRGEKFIVYKSAPAP